MQKVKNLGKRFPVGHEFQTTTKRMTKFRGLTSTTQFNDPKFKHFITYEVWKTGDFRMVQKGKRKYYCRVVGLIEMRTGCYHYEYCPNHYNPAKRFTKWYRWYQFTYIVKIVEN